MHATSRAFKQNADHALADAALQKALGPIKRGFVEKRAAAAAACPSSRRCATRPGTSRTMC